MSLSLVKKLVLALVVVAVLGAVAAVAGVAGVFWWYGRDIAEIDQERLRNYRPPLVTEVVSREGELIGEIYTQRRTLVHYGDIPSHVENAFLAAEDADFYHHEGMDLVGMVRALVVNLRAGEIRQGASTITQQVVKIFLLSPERTFERKVQELVLARRLEQALSKREILELYLNEIYLGHGRYGIEEASRFYFGKGVAEIDMGQAALLATLPKAPGRDSPLQQPERAKQRQAWVLQQMVSHGFADPAQAQPFIDGPLNLAEPTGTSRVVPGAEEFADEVRAQLQEEFGAERLPYLGARVVTTVSLPVQRAARAGLVAGLQGIDGRQHYGHKLKVASKKRREAVKAWGDGALSVGTVTEALVEGHEPAAEGMPSGFFARIGSHPIFVVVPPGSRYREADVALAEQFPVDAVVQVRVVVTSGPKLAAAGLPEGGALAEVAAGPEAAVVVAEAATGEVLAMIGGAEYQPGDFNRATRAARQPGSSFKPFVYGAALASGQFTAATLVSDSPEIYEKWRPTNFEVDVYRGDIRLREALTHSVNTVAIKLADRLGVPAVQAFARAAGLTAELPDDLSVALGTGEVTPFDLLGGYLTIARGGRRLSPVLVREIQWPDGRVTHPEREESVAFGEDVAFVLTSMMTSVVRSGTATRAKALGRPAAGKTGTSAEHHDAWFAGFTPSTVAVAWVGFDRPRPLGRGETGGRAAIPIWLAAMEAAETGPVRPFTPPSTVTIRRIDAKTGLLAPPDAPADGTLDEYFVPGSEPIDEAPAEVTPAGDVLLDLYGDAAGELPASGAADGSAAPSAATPAPSGPVGLPSLDDLDAPSD